MPDPKPKIGIALGSGGARGWIHVGVLQALKDEGFEPDIVAGCSMGALVGAAFAAGWLDELEEWAISITRRDIVRLLDINLLNGGVIDGSRVMDVLRGFKGDALIQELEKPYMAIASDLTTGREVWLRDGSVFDAVRASVSIPGFLRPYNLNGQWLVDGGLTNPVPVSACRAMGADFIIAVNPDANILKYIHEGNNKKTKPDHPDGSYSALMDRMLETVPPAVKERIRAMTPGFLNADAKPLSYMAVLSSSIDIMTSQIMRSRLAGEPPHIMLDPQLGPFGTIEFNRAAEAIAEGRRIVQEALPFLHRQLG